jgi:hypothetical protein
VTSLPFPTWGRDLARLEGALPFLSPTLATMLAQRSLRRLWAHHVTAFPFDDHGLEHVPSPEAGELVRSWSARERQDFCSWIARRGPAPLAEAARILLRAKGLTERFSGPYDPAERALARLDALLPAHDPLATLTEWVRQLREDEVPFLEGVAKPMSSTTRPMIARHRAARLGLLPWLPPCVRSCLGWAPRRSPSLAWRREERFVKCWSRASSAGLATRSIAPRKPRGLIWPYATAWRFWAPTGWPGATATPPRIACGVCWLASAPHPGRSRARARGDQSNRVAWCDGAL